jgi:hypothetical protein
MRRGNPPVRSRKMPIWNVTSGNKPSRDGEVPHRRLRRRPQRKESSMPTCGITGLAAPTGKAVGANSDVGPNMNTAPRAVTSVRPGIGTQDSVGTAPGIAAPEAAGDHVGLKSRNSQRHAPEVMQCLSVPDEAPLDPRAPNSRGARHAHAAAAASAADRRSYTPMVARHSRQKPRIAASVARVSWPVVPVPPISTTDVRFAAVAEPRATKPPMQPSSSDT